MSAKVECPKSERRYCTFLVQTMIMEPMIAVGYLPVYEFEVNWEVDPPENAPFRVKVIEPECGV